MLQRFEVMKSSIRSSPGYALPTATYSRYKVSLYDTTLNVGITDVLNKMNPALH